MVARSGDFRHATDWGRQVLFPMACLKNMTWSVRKSLVYHCMMPEMGGYGNVSECPNCESRLARRPLAFQWIFVVQHGHRPEKIGCSWQVPQRSEGSPSESWQKTGRHSSIIKYLTISQVPSDISIYIIHFGNVYTYIYIYIYLYIYTLYTYIYIYTHIHI